MHTTKTQWLSHTASTICTRKLMEKNEIREELHNVAWNEVDGLNPKRIKAYASEMLKNELEKIMDMGVMTIQECVEIANKNEIFPSKRTKRKRGGSILMQVRHFTNDPKNNGFRSIYCLVPTSYRTKSLVRVAKALAGFTGHKGESVSFGNEIEIFLRGVNDTVNIQFPESLPVGAELSDITNIRKSYATNLKREAA